MSDFAIHGGPLLFMMGTSSHTEFYANHMTHNWPPDSFKMEIGYAGIKRD